MVGWFKNSKGSPRFINRDVALDRFRGMAVILMVIVNDLSDVSAVPGFLKHAPDMGFTLADIVAPLFIFSIAVSYRKSFQRRAEISKSRAYLHFTRRYFAIIGIGSVFSAGGVVVSRPSSWGVLEAIGVAGLLTLLFIRLPAWTRFAAGLGILSTYQFFLNTHLLETVLQSSHGGFFGALSWGAMLILSTAAVDWLEKSKKCFLLGTGILTILAVVSTFIVPVSKNRVSLSYILLSLTLCCAIYFAVMAISELTADSTSPNGVARRRIKPDLVAYWGENPLLLYLLHLILMGIFMIPPILAGFEIQPLWMSLLSNLILLAILTFIAQTLHRKNIFFSL